MDITEFERRLHPEGKDETRKSKPGYYRDRNKRIRKLKREIGSKRYRELDRELLSMQKGQARAFNSVIRLQRVDDMRLRLRRRKKDE